MPCSHHFTRSASFLSLLRRPAVVRITLRSAAGAAGPLKRFVRCHSHQRRQPARRLAISSRTAETRSTGTSITVCVVDS